MIGYWHFMKIWRKSTNISGLSDIKQYNKTKTHSFSQFKQFSKFVYFLGALSFTSAVNKWNRDCPWGPNIYIYLTSLASFFHEWNYHHIVIIKKEHNFFFIQTRAFKLIFLHINNLFCYIFFCINNNGNYIGHYTILAYPLTRYT